MHLRLLRTLGNPAHVPSALLLASPEPGRGLGALLERALPRRQQAGHRQLRVTLEREEGVDEGGTHLSAEANV